MSHLSGAVHIIDESLSLIWCSWCVPGFVNSKPTNSQGIFDKNGNQANISREKKEERKRNPTYAMIQEI